MSPSRAIEANKSRHPDERSWVVSVLVDGDVIPIGTGVVIDSTRILTCAHVVELAGDKTIRVAFPLAENAAYQPSLPVIASRIAANPQFDVAILEIAGIPADVSPAPLGRADQRALPGQPWWAYGFFDPTGDEADGTIGSVLAYGQIRINGESRYQVRAGFSGGGLWSPTYNAVVGIVIQALRDDGRVLSLQAIVRSLPDEKIDLLVGSQPVRAAGSDAARAWGWALEDDAEGVRHWRPRSRGVSSDSERGWRFRGRAAALGQIRSWLTSQYPDRKVLVVTGSPGIGKSAVLARVVTTADAGIAAQLPRDDDAVRVPVGSVACAVHAKGKTALDVATEIARGAGAALPETLDDAIPAISRALTEAMPTRFAVVIDALDEAATPEDARQIIRQLLVPLAETCADVGAQVLVGTRRNDAEGNLIGAFASACQLIDLDDDLYFAPEDLTAYALATIQLQGAERKGNPYNHTPTAERLAARITEVSDRNFLVAGLIARTHGLHDSHAVRPSSIRAVEHGQDAVAVRLSEYLARVAGPSQELTASEALTALAFAEAPGFTLSLWRHIIGAVYRRDVSEDELFDFSSGVGANFLIETAASAGGSYRLFHQALNDTLLLIRSVRQSRIDDERLITNELIAIGRIGGWAKAPAYIHRSLASHAAVAEAIDLVLAETEYLLYADLRRLLPVAGHAKTSAGQDRLRLLRRAPTTLSASPLLRAAQFSVNEASGDVGTGFTDLDVAAPYRLRWAHIQPPGSVTVLEGHTDWVNGVSEVSAKAGKVLLASASTDKTVRLWDPETGASTAVLEGHTSGVNATCQVVSSTGQVVLASASTDQTLRLWDLETGATTAVLQGHAQGVIAVCQITTRDDRVLLASGSDDGTIRLWDPETGTTTAVLEGHTSGVNAVCQVTTSSNRILLASGGGTDDGTVRLWDPETGSAAAVLLGHTGGVNAVCQITTSDGRVLLASGGGTEDESVRLWDPETGECIAVFEAHILINSICQIQMSSGETRLVIAGDGTLQIWNTGSLEMESDLSGHFEAIRGVCQISTMDGKRILASASDDGSVRLWDPETNHVSRDFDSHVTQVRSMCRVTTSSGKELMASASYSDTVRLWNAETGGAVASFHSDGWVSAVCRISPRYGPPLLACGGSDHGGSVTLWDPETAEARMVMRGSNYGVNVVCQIGPVVERFGLPAIRFPWTAALTRQAMYLVSAGYDGMVRLWNVSTGESAALIKSHAGSVTGLCQLVTSTGRILLASAGVDRTVRLWDPASRETVAVLRGHASGITGICQVSVGKGRNLLASGSDDRTVRIWDPVAAKTLAVLRGHTSQVTAICEIVTDTDRILLASAGIDRTLRIWNLSDGGSITINLPGEATALYSFHDTIVIGTSNGVLAIALDLSAARSL